MDTAYRGFEGEWEISIGDAMPSTHAPAARRFVRACSSAGMPAGDYNGSSPARASLSQYTIDSTARRNSTAAAFLRGDVSGVPNALSHTTKNLTVATRCYVEHIVTKDKKCRGVLLRRHGDDHSTFISSRKETILCAGAVQTPQLLLLSGIGPKEELAQVPGVTPVHNLPGVGRNLQDHLFVPTLWPMKAGFGDTIANTDQIGVQLSILMKYFVGTGTASLSPVQVRLSCIATTYYIRWCTKWNRVLLTPCV